MGADRERGKMAEIKQYVEILLESLKKKEKYAPEYSGTEYQTGRSDQK